MKRDNQRSRVYKAEGIPLECEMTLSECAEFAGATCKKAKRDIYRLFPELKDRIDGRTIKVKDGRGRRKACFDPNVWAIKLPRWSRSKQVVCHEVAHAYAYMLSPRPAWHGREFAGIYLLLVKHGLGEEAYRDLRKRFCQGRVDFKC